MVGFQGQVENLCPDDKNLKIPHMGWNEVNFKRDDGRFSDLNGEDFYFVHSYYFNAKDTDNILATTNYNQPFPSALIKNNIIGTQFHPEKSQRSGSRIHKKISDVEAMILYPAIDLINKECVRLKKGDYSKKTVFNKDPLKQAQIFESEGCTWVHIVDLDAAKGDESENGSILLEIKKKTNLKIQFGGGIRTSEK